MSPLPSTGPLDFSTSRLLGSHEIGGLVVVVVSLAAILYLPIPRRESGIST
jgi:hypothetical protein